MRRWRRLMAERRCFGGPVSLTDFREPFFQNRSIAKAMAATLSCPSGRHSRWQDREYERMKRTTSHRTEVRDAGVQPAVYRPRPIHQWPEGERPRERLLAHGVAVLSDAE